MGNGGVCFFECILEPNGPAHVRIGSQCPQTRIFHVRGIFQTEIETHIKVQITGGRGKLQPKINS